MQASLRSTFGTLSFALALALTACTGQVIGGASSGTTTSTDNSATDGSGGCTGGCNDDPPDAAPTIAIAFRADQVGWPGSGTGGSGGSSSSSSGGVDPNTVFLSLGNQGTTCADPTQSVIDCQDDFNVQIGIPPAL